MVWCASVSGCLFVCFRRVVVVGLYGDVHALSWFWVGQGWAGVCVCVYVCVLLALVWSVMTMPHPDTHTPQS